MTHRLPTIALLAALLAGGCQAQAPAPTAGFALNRSASAPTQHLMADTRTAYSTTVSTLAGTGKAGFMEGPAATAKFNAPHGIAVDAAGNLYVADTFNMGIRMITPAGMVMTVGLPFVLGKIVLPKAVAVMGNGTLAVLENQKNRIQFLDAMGNVTPFVGGKLKWEGTGLPQGTYGYQDGKGDLARFQTMYDFCVDGAGNMYVSDSNRIRKVYPDGTVVTLAGVQKVGHVDGDGGIARFNTVRGIAVDAQGVLYVADSGNDRIRKIVPNPLNPSQVTVTDYAGGAAGFLDGSEGRYAMFNNPTDVAVDGLGNVYVTDTGNHCIRKILAGSSEVITLAGGSEGATDGPGNAAQFSAPDQLAVDGNGTIYVTDLKNNKIRMIQQQ